MKTETLWSTALTPTATISSSAPAPMEISTAPKEERSNENALGEPPSQAFAFTAAPLFWNLGHLNLTSCFEKISINFITNAEDFFADCEDSDCFIRFPCSCGTA